MKPRGNKSAVASDDAPACVFLRAGAIRYFRWSTFQRPPLRRACPHASPPCFVAGSDAVARRTQGRHYWGLAVHSFKLLGNADLRTMMRFDTAVTGAPGTGLTGLGNAVRLMIAKKQQHALLLSKPYSAIINGGAMTSPWAAFATTGMLRELGPAAGRAPATFVFSELLNIVEGRPAF